MPVEIVIPNVGESVTSGVVSAWRKKDGDTVQRDDVVMDLETDKITMEVRAPAAGILRTLAKEGDEVPIGAVVGSVEENGRAAAPASDVSATERPAEKPSRDSTITVPGKPPSEPAAAPAPKAPAPDADTSPDGVRATPLARKLAEERGIDLSKVRPTGAGHRVREQDVLEFARGRAPAGPSAAPAPRAVVAAEQNIAAVDAAARAKTGAAGRAITRERMSPLRQRVAQRLVEAQHTAAMLTTFNECDMTAVIAARGKYKEDFEKRHGTGLGFMSFFVQATVSSLRAFPLVNASIVADESGHPAIEKHDYVDIAIAVASPKGLVVPVIRDCQSLSMAQIEAAIKDLGTRAKDGKLTLEEMQGGTFTITNGGIFGSLMSTPILNPPQSAILGMHAIKSRAVEDPDKPGQVVIRPMMYLALSYDHRIIDGAEAVRFLVRIKESIEDPRRLLLGL